MIDERRHWSVESQLLLAAACPNPSPADVRRANEALSCGAIDWDRFEPLANVHGVLPLLVRHLSAGTFDARLVPDAAATRLRARAERTARRALMLSRELTLLLRAFGQDGIGVVSLKGPILAEQLYGSVAMRRMGDLDLLIDEKDLERGMALLARVGYQLQASSARDAIDVARRTGSPHLSFCSSTRPVRVELHYCLLPPLGRRRYHLATIADDLERRAFLGESACVLRPELLLVYLCAHGKRHLWERIEWIGGVAELLRRGHALEWERVEELSGRLAAERAVSAALHLANALFDLPIPPTSLPGDRSARVAARSVATRLTSQPSAALRPTTRLLHWIQTDSGMRTRLARVWTMLFIDRPADRAAVPLPRALRPLYTIVRPARLFLVRLRRFGPQR